MPPQVDKMLSGQEMSEHGLLSRLRRSAVAYRHALALLDPGYIDWRSSGKSPHHLAFVDHIPLLMDDTQNIGYCLSPLSGGNAPNLAQFINNHCVNEWQIFEEESFRLLKPYVPNGKWRLSRNYQANAPSFRPNPNGIVRKLGPEDIVVYEKRKNPGEETLQRTNLYPAITDYPSTIRDFQFMMDGLPVICYGMFTEGCLVGFCSANPIYTGVMEISWLVVSEAYRRRGIASALLTAIAQEIFYRGKVAAYYAGSAGEDLNDLLTRLGFQETKSCYRFIPLSSKDQWRTSWGKPL